MKIDEITTQEIEQDIGETEAEIVIMEREIKGFRLIGERLSHFKADGRVEGIRKRKEFIEKLNGILKERGAR